VKVTYVIHRYGAEVTAGAEHATRLLAEHLRAHTGWDVEVLTTCALGTDWENEYSPGRTELNGVPVTRFTSQVGRAADFLAISDQVLPLGERAPLELQERWLDAQGPVNPDLLDAVEQSDADVIVFSPYLYYPTARGIERVRERAVLQPATHDEMAVRLPVYRRVFGAPRALSFFTDSERRLTNRLFPVATKPQVVSGLGVDRGVAEAPPFGPAVGLGDRPFVLVLGRVDPGKGSSIAAEYFRAYKRRHPGDLALVFVGPVVEAPAVDDDVLVAGAVDEAAKWAALRDAEIFLSPSPFESFSIVLMEAWLAGRPVVVNGACEVTREHCQRSGGGLWFNGYAEFEGVLSRLGDADIRVQLGTAGRRYVERHYGWPSVMERYAAFLGRLSNR
jgi:glycosyltransferase involved in cell wall biosynthesis